MVRACVRACTSLAVAVAIFTQHWMFLLVSNFQVNTVGEVRALCVGRVDVVVTHNKNVKQDLKITHGMLVYKDTHYDNARTV